LSNYIDSITLDYESFACILYKMMFICDMGTISNLFGKIRRDANFGNAIIEILRKSKGEKRDMM